MQTRLMNGGDVTSYPRYARPAVKGTTLEALAKAAQGGDERAYDRLISAILPHLRQFVGRRRFFASNDIDDLCQDILVSMHKHIGTYDPRRPLLPWLYRIALSRLADGGRRYFRNKAREVHMDILPDHLWVSCNESAGDDFLNAVKLEAAIKCLPRRQRQAVEMLGLGKMTTEEAIAASGSTHGALRCALHHGIAALRKALNDDADRQNRPAGGRLTAGRPSARRSKAGSAQLKSAF